MADEIAGAVINGADFRILEEDKTVAKDIRSTFCMEGNKQVEAHYKRKNQLIAIEPESFSSAPDVYKVLPHGENCYPKYYIGFWCHATGENFVNFVLVATSKSSGPLNFTLVNNFTIDVYISQT